MLHRPRSFSEQQVRWCVGSFKTLVSLWHKYQSPDFAYPRCSYFTLLVYLCLMNLITYYLLLYHLVSAFHLKKKKNSPLQEKSEHVPRNGIQQHPGDAGRHDFWPKRHGCCHDVTKRIPADMPEVMLEQQYCNKASSVGSCFI